MTLDELRSLDPKNIGSWPVLPKLGVLLVALLLLIIASYLLDWQGPTQAIQTPPRKENPFPPPFP